MVALAVMGCPVGQVCDEVKDKFGHLRNKTSPEVLNLRKLRPSEEQMIKVKRKFEHLKEKRADRKTLEELVNLNPGAYSTEEILDLFRKYQLKLDLKAFTRRREGTRKIIFYLFSRSVPARTTDSVFSQAGKLPKGIEFYGVLTGIDRKTLTYLRKLKSFGAVRIKINPYIFEKAGAGVVPAFVYAECPEGEFRSRLCEYRYVLYGDVPLGYALEKFLEKER